MTWRRYILTGWLGLALSACDAVTESSQAPFPHAIMTPQPAKTLPDLTLTDGTGSENKLSNLNGKWIWLYFGFTHCPDVCPVAMDAMVGQYKKLKQADQVLPVFVSVDPKRDANRALKTFTTYYHPAFLGLTGKREAIDELTRAVGAAYVIDTPAKPGGDYNVSHSNLVFVLDPQGRHVATYTPEEKALADDFNALLTEK